jgi:hypothetical protein
MPLHTVSFRTGLITPPPSRPFLHVLSLRTISYRSGSSICDVCICLSRCVSCRWIMCGWCVSIIVLSSCPKCTQKESMNQTLHNGQTGQPTPIINNQVDDMNTSNISTGSNTSISSTQDNQNLLYYLISLWV